MKRHLIIPVVIILFSVFDLSVAFSDDTSKYITNSKPLNVATDLYGIQWEMSYGRSPFYGARYEGPQPIGDCDNDGDNELLIGGRDAMLRVMEWNDDLQTYQQTHTLRCPFYPFIRQDSDGFAIGDLTGDGDNEIAVSWYATVHKFVNGRYRIMAWNPWVEWNGGGNPDCYIGDCDNDGLNELIMSCRDWRRSVPEIVIFKWNGKQLVKYADWDDVGVNGEVFMAGLGDVDEDGENEIVLGSSNKVVVLNWNTQTKQFAPTILVDNPAQGYENHPFACVCKDSDMDGLDEIHIGFYSPRITIFEWNGSDYIIKFEKEWPGEGLLIESLDVGDVDNDTIAEVCAGTDIIHILQWNGITYEEEAIIDETYGDLAVVSIGDCDNDGRNEINAGSVIVDFGKDYKSWVFKYGWVS